MPGGQPTPAAGSGTRTGRAQPASDPGHVGPPRRSRCSSTPRARPACRRRHADQLESGDRPATMRWAPSTSTTPRSASSPCRCSTSEAPVGPVRDVAGRQVRDPARRRPGTRCSASSRPSGSRDVRRPAVLMFLLVTPGVEDRDYSSLRTCSTAPPHRRGRPHQLHAGLQVPLHPALRHDRDDGTIAALRAEDHDPGGPRHHLLAGRHPAPGVELRIVVPDTNDGGGRSGPRRGDLGPLALQHGGLLETPPRRQRPSADGWLHTGDAGYIDADGYLFLHDRIKDMVVTGGGTSIPPRWRTSSCRTPGGRRRMIGVPDEKWGEAVKPSWCAPACVAATAPSR